MARGAFFQYDETTSDLSDNAYRVLGYLRHHVVKSDVVYPSIESMSDDLKRSVRTCKYALAELKAAGLINVERDQKGRWAYRILGAKTCTARVQKTAPSAVQNSATDGATHSATDGATRSAKFCIPPNNPLICKTTETTETTEEKRESVSEESKPADFAGDCSLALSDLGQKPPPIPAEIKRMATEVNALAWIANVQFQEIPMTDWRVKETLRAIQARGGNKGVNYAWKIFNDLPETEPPKTNGHMNGNGKYRPNEPTHVPNLMPKRVKSRNENTLTGYWNRLAELPIPGVELKAWADRMHSTPTEQDPESYETALKRILTEAAESVK